MYKQPQITDATREAFIQAFGEFYQQRPIEKITVKEIAERAGYSRATFYNYFSDQYQLLQYIEDRFIDTFIGRLSDNWAKDRGLNGFIGYFVEMAQLQGDYMKLLLGNPHNTQLIGRIKQRVMPLLQEMLQVDADDLRVRYALEMYAGGMLTLFARWLQDEQAMPVTELAELVDGVLKEGFWAQLTPNRAC